MDSRKEVYGKMKEHTDFVGLGKRKFPRLNENILILASLNSDREFKALTENISESGLMFETTRVIPRDTLLELEMYQPICCCKSIIFSIPVLARVVWIKKREKDHFEKGENKYAVGGEFFETKKEDRQRIAKYVKDKTAGR